MLAQPRIDLLKLLQRHRLAPPQHGTHLLSNLCAGADSRPAVIRQTRKDRSEVNASRQQVRCRKIRKGGRRAQLAAQVSSITPSLALLQSSGAAGAGSSLIYIAVTVPT